MSRKSNAQALTTRFAAVMRHHEHQVLEKVRVSFNREKVKHQVATLAAKGVFIGTSSWKYPGWVGTLYEEQRYLTRGKVSKRKVEDNCLPEYAQVFKTVCVDGAYYKFPSRGISEQTRRRSSGRFSICFQSHR